MIVVARKTYLEIFYRHIPLGPLGRLGAKTQREGNGLKSNLGAQRLH